MQAVSQLFVEQAISNLQGVYSCTSFHAGMTCNQKALSQFLISVKSVFKMYLIVHLIPFLLFKRKKVKQNPGKEILKLFVGLGKSLLFAGGYTAIIRRIVCLITQHHKFVGYSNIFAAAIAGVTFNFEPIGRQSQMALFCLNKTTQVVYLLCKRRDLPVTVPGGQCLLMMGSIGIICYHYLNNRQSIRQSYLNLMDRVLDDC